MGGGGRDLRVDEIAPTLLSQSKRLSAVIQGKQSCELGYYTFKNNPAIYSIGFK